MKIRRLLVAAAFPALCAALHTRAQTPLIKTPAEACNYSRYSQHDDIARFLADVSRTSRQVYIQAIGKTLESKELAAVDLRLCVITGEGITSPERLNRGKLTILVFASQHGNEQSAKEAALLLIRDLVTGNLHDLLNKVNVLVIPQSNPYGNFVNRRQNEQGLDLNRDHVKLEAPETRAIHDTFRAWMPEVTLDVHEKGDDYYRVSTGCVSNLNIHESLQRYSRERIFPAIEKSVTADGYTWFEYLVSEPVGSSSAAGVRERPGERANREMLMRYSTTDLNDGRNGPGIYETLSFIQEGASRHDLATLEARTRWQYSGVRALVEAAANNAAEIRTLVAARRAELLRNARSSSAASRVHLRMEYVRDPKEPELKLSRFERRAPGTGSAAPEPKVISETVRNWYPRVESKLAVARAAGYIIPASRGDVLKSLLDHGIRAGALAQNTKLEVEIYRIREIVPAKDDYVAPEKIEVDVEPAKVQIPKGDFYVSCAQPGANLIPSLLEPQSEYGLIRYKVYKLAPGKGDAYPILRVRKAGKLPLREASATQE